MTLFLVSDGFFWRQRRQDLDTIGFLNMPPLFLIIIFFFPSSYLRQAFNTIPNSSVSDTTRHDTIHFFFFLSFFSFFLSFFLEFEDGNLNTL